MKCVLFAQKWPHQNQNLEKLGKKGLSSLTEVSIKKNDGLCNRIDSIENIYVHEKCYKNYTHPTSIQKAKYNNDSSSKDKQRKLSTRIEKVFDYKTHCLICAGQVDFPDMYKNPKAKRQSSVSSVVTVGSKRKEVVIQNTLLAMCEKRQDKIAVDVKARIQFAGDIRAVEAIYHRRCMQRFMSGGGITSKNTRNLDVVRQEAFLEIANG